MLIVSNNSNVYVVWDPEAGQPCTGLLSRADVLRYLVPGGRTNRHFEQALQDAHRTGIGAYGSTTPPAGGYLRFRTGRIRASDVIECVRYLASAEPELADRFIV